MLALKASRDDLDDARDFVDTLARSSGNDPDRAAAWTRAIARSDESVVPAEQGTRDDQRCRVCRPGRESN
ncbi:hypothetical protein [Saccharopolyspora elongata]|uniref:hypothetical protein n=1 Tax=Saccharopolyspora elongata TaxID=2530387 RepID=UPI001405367C|nr:hypothetical protein [Saccharopolyspora elongata]